VGYNVAPLRKNFDPHARNPGSATAERPQSVKLVYAHSLGLSMITTLSDHYIRLERDFEMVGL